MSLTENFMLIFTDTLIANIVFCFTNELAISTVKIFDHHNVYITIATAIFAFILASIFNYIFGTICFKILKPMQIKREDVKDLTSNTNKNNYSYLILILSAIPFFGKFMMFFAGFAKINFKKALFVTVLSKALYYIYFIILT